MTAHPAHEPASRLGVLLVDDVADIRLLLRSLFAVYPGVEVVGEAGDGQQAIELAGTTQPDLVVLDLSMPVMDGVAALPAIREAAPGARVVVLSAIPRSVDPGAMEAGAVAYVEKSATSTTVASPRSLSVGDQAPEVSLPGSDGKQYSLAAYRGRQAVVLAWFSKAFTEG